jgi:hypothetical protein
MDELNRLITDNLVVVIAILAALLLVLLLLLVVQSIRLGRAVRDYRTLVGDGRGGSLDDVLEQHIGRVDAVSRRMGEMEEVHAGLEHRTLTSLQHIGLVRFNPFEDTGSDQSFVIALLDDRRDGVVISSLHGRSTTRLFAKPVANGGSSHTLSTEETQAISIAVEGIAPASPA